MTNQFKQDVLEEHNRVRAQHSAAPLQLDESICRYAQSWANHLAATNKLQHRTTNKYGENLYVLLGRAECSGVDVVQSWYKERKDYTFGQPDPGLRFSKVGHFTQVVWKDCTHLGVGMAIATGGKGVYVVCNYNPPGNVKNRYSENVAEKFPVP
ncbi:Golgi-associated plant pathogenesis-related protein 1-like [Armigeres subalbatus]|uniref:Golgi-associated plant pathogenesis-related protein 1-like n=1 Tax=Armigeres subalbatus TaxID=124917 RepID=UPI002ED45EAE